MPKPDQTGEAVLEEAALERLTQVFARTLQEGCPDLYEAMNTPPCAAPPTSPPTPGPIRAALERLADAIEGIELEGVPDVVGAIAAASAALAANPAAPPPSGPRRFDSLTRTFDQRGHTVLDAIDTDGRAWWLVLGDDAAPIDWTELEPLPTYEEQP